VRSAHRDAVELALVCAASFTANFVSLVFYFSEVLQRSRTVDALVCAAAGVAAAIPFIVGLHELLHVATVRALGSRAAVKVFPLGFQTLFLDPLPLRKAALVYLAPLLVAPAPLALQAASLPWIYAILWVAQCFGDAIALCFRLSEKAEALVCTLDGRVIALR